MNLSSRVAREAHPPQVDQAISALRTGFKGHSTG